MSDEQTLLVGMLEPRPDGVYCIPCQRLFRSIGSHLRKHGLSGKHNRSTLQRMFGLPMGSRFASDSVRASYQRAAIENGAVFQVRSNPPNMREAVHAAAIARHLGQRSDRQQAASHALAAGAGRAALPAARARHQELAFLRNRAVITCEHCSFTLVVRRRTQAVTWPRVCSRRCRRLKRETMKKLTSREVWLAAHQARRRKRSARPAQ